MESTHPELNLLRLTTLNVIRTQVVAVRSINQFVPLMEKPTFSHRVRQVAKNVKRNHWAPKILHFIQSVPVYL